VALIDLSVFKPAYPIVEPENLPPEYAADLLDCDLTRGGLRATKLDSLQTSIAISVDTQSIYFNGNVWYQWPGLVDVAKNFDSITSKRVLITGDGYPKETDTALGDTGLGPWPAATRRNGLPAPADAPGILLGGVAGTDEKGRYSWVYTYYYTRPDGSVIESAPSPPTAVITVMDGETVTLTTMAYPDPAVAGCSYTGIRIYRMVATESGALYHFVHEQTDVLDWLDDVSDETASANAILETMDMSSGYPVSWEKPIDTLKGITLVDYGYFVGYDGNKIYPSVLFVGYAFPGKYSLSTDSQIKGLGYTGSVVIVLTEANPYMLYGQDPATLSLRRLNYVRPCIGKTRSIVSTPVGVIFPSLEGLAMIDATGTEHLLTENIFTQDQWTALNPDNFISFLYRGKYVAFESGTQNVHIIDFKKGLYEKGQAYGVVRAAFQKEEDKRIYIVVDNVDVRELRKWRGGLTKAYYWESKTFSFGSKTFFSRAKITGDFSGGGTVSVTLCVDGVDRPAITVTGPGIVNIGRFYARSISAKFSGKATVTRFLLGSSAREVLNV